MTTHLNNKYLTLFVQNDCTSIKYGKWSENTDNAHNEVEDLFVKIYECVMLMKMQHMPISFILHHLKENLISQDWLTEKSLFTIMLF